MSHNLYTLNSVGANVFSYHGANKGIIYLGRGEDANYADTSPSVITNSTTFVFYDTNPINTISGASLVKNSTGSDWYKEVTLPAGTYYICTSFDAELTTYQGMYLFYKENGVFNQNGVTGIGINTVYQVLNNPFSSSMFKVFQYASTTTIRFDVALATGSGTTNPDPNNRVSKSSFLFIRKLA